MSWDRHGAIELSLGHFSWHKAKKRVPACDMGWCFKQYAPTWRSIFENGKPSTGTNCGGTAVSKFETYVTPLRLALVADGKGVTYVSNLLTAVPPQLVPVEGLPFSNIDRQVGAYCLKHQPMSQAGTRFLALCHEKWPRESSIAP